MTRLIRKIRKPDTKDAQSTAILATPPLSLLGDQRACKVTQGVIGRIRIDCGVNYRDIAQLTNWYNELRQHQPQQPLIVHKLIEHQCKAQPTAPAVHAWDGILSYRAIDLLSSRLAAYLVHEGIGPERIVPICFEKSKWLAVIMLAVVKAGATFLFLDPYSQPLERLQLIVNQTKGSLILTSESMLSTAVLLGTRSVLVADGAPCFEGNHSRSTNTPDLPMITDRTALYVIFTSGSTGVPKGVVIEHHGYAAGALARRKVTGLNSNSRVLQYSSCTFDTFITDILDTLIAGACICIPSESARRTSLAQVARDMGVTYADLVPSVARLIRPEEIPTLETLVLSGEPVSRSDVSEWAGKVRLCNLYGPAECSAVAAGHAFSTPDSTHSNIGRGCGGTCWVVNPTDSDMLMPIGAVGELIVEGSIVGRGYLGRVYVEAASSFLESAPPWRQIFPCSGTTTRMYKTGDLVRYQDDGTLVFVGRKDNQVKLHGQRLELGDVEHHLRAAFPASKDVVAVMVSLPIDRRVAFIVGRNQGEAAPTVTDGAAGGGHIHIASAPEFRHLIHDAEKVLRKSLPAYMIPMAYFPVQGLPRTSSGKVDRGQLQRAATELILQEGIENFTAARSSRIVYTDAEKALQSIWAHVLGIEPTAISSENGFLELGGDSITAMKVAAKAASCGLHISIPKLFQNESLQFLAAGMESSRSANPISWEVEIALSPSMEAHTSRAQTMSIHRPGLPVEVLLTGATGRLGREILRRLIECPSMGMVHCVAIRGPNKVSPDQKVLVYHGNLSRKRLGTSEQEEAKIRWHCQAIIHCGAIVLFVQDYETMRSVNVESTKYLADLALQNYIPFHYISTAGVGQEDGHAILEAVSAACKPPVDGADRYTATNWVSEVFLERVNSQFGLDITIHRPSNIICDGDPETDIINNLLEYSRRLRAVPRLEGWEGHFDFIRGEVVASSIVQSVMHRIRDARDGARSQQGVRYIHESGVTVIPVNGLGEYLARASEDYRHAELGEASRARGHGRCCGRFPMWYGGNWGKNDTASDQEQSAAVARALSRLFKGAATRAILISMAPVVVDTELRWLLKSIAA